MFFLRIRIFSYITTMIKIRKLTLTQYHLIHNTNLYLVKSPPNVLHSKNFSEPVSSSGLCITFSCHVSLVTFNLEQFFSLCFLRHRHFWKTTGQLFCRTVSNLGFSAVSSWLDQNCLQKQNSNKKPQKHLNCLMIRKWLKKL